MAKPAATRRSFGFLATFVGLAILHTWPLVTAPGTLSRNDNGDAILHEWIMAWVAHQAVVNPLHSFDANIYARDAVGLGRSLEETARYSAVSGDYLAVPGRLYFEWRRIISGRNPLHQAASRMR